MRRCIAVLIVALLAVAVTRAEAQRAATQSVVPKSQDHVEKLTIPSSDDEIEARLKDGSMSLVIVDAGILMENWLFGKQNCGGIQEITLSRAINGQWPASAGDPLPPVSDRPRGHRQQARPARQALSPP